jgi:hypothetical protein
MGEFSRLPSRFPVGTRYVMEGRGGRVSLRYLEFPDGRKIELPADLAKRAKARLRGRRTDRVAARTGSKKNIGRTGTRQELRG